MDGQTDNGKLIVAFRNFAKSPYKSPSLIEICFIWINNLKVSDRRKSPVHIKHSFYCRQYSAASGVAAPLPPAAPRCLTQLFKRAGHHFQVSILPDLHRPVGKDSQNESRWRSTRSWFRNFSSILPSCNVGTFLDLSI